jgi:hypothetical protein
MRLPKIDSHLCDRCSPSTTGIVPGALPTTAAAILLFTITAIGYGLGPMLIGWLNDGPRSCDVSPT